MYLCIYILHSVYKSLIVVESEHLPFMLFFIRFITQYFCFTHMQFNFGHACSFYEYSKKKKVC